MGYEEEFIDKLLESIDGCLSISVNSCEKCMCRGMPSPRCKNKLISVSADVIRYLKEQKNEN